MKSSYNRLIFILSLIGILVAIYVLQSFIRQSSIVCVNNGCEIVRKSLYSYPLGIPVPAFGLIGYSLLTLFTFLRTISSDRRLLYGILGISVFGVLFVSWFTFMELFIIKAVCTWCAVSAINMFIIFFLVVKIHQMEVRKK
ncbi:hypothetical protein A3D78_02085 [Candidatus Gottesmanbacteria bacterium RIFCSPHIGHO2_02_FULL_39_14]|uniref:Vitamin K epoxide reductase domain-containing protein n=3 Tax=Candidatus Gottesmaniibacteriota TaxID=1752720 RepID=A0A1F6A290_9BACT|nr:MAG: hypothetical protein A2153_04785 [Candidatus Gottesmanbacteria bacterium RBG_16_38_7b]OGG18783.1 MAG: hypothetical protein A3D78_02085 [Candidatus Gottesmanbacteria bacterium RIFCSPHIGHO2_02_FULL_39_14]OGG31072.1 MAG: hypothetical protein A3I51_02970 [Candidatus Gottesmanbacteria bacterium RIFCSPLOWO2_02_FULL_38_8]